jgi:DeoR-like helix-turn-helix domain
MTKNPRTPPLPARRYKIGTKRRFIGIEVDENYHRNSSYLLFLSLFASLWSYDAIVRITRLRMGSSILAESEGTVPHDPAMAASAAELPLEGMMADERRTQILKTVRSAGRVRVNELASRFSTSAVTIRNDLNELHR